MLVCNVGKTDRALRVIGGGVLIYLAYTLNINWLYIGFIPLFTGLLRCCPLYIPLKWNTCSSQNSCCSTSNGSSNHKEGSSCCAGSEESSNHKEGASCCAGSEESKNHRKHSGCC